MEQFAGYKSGSFSYDGQNMETRNMKLFSPALVLAALFAMSSAAQAEMPDYFKNFSGYIRGYVSKSSYSYSTWDDSWRGHGADGALNWHLPNNTDLELDVQKGISWGDDYDTYNSLYALHWSMRNSQFLVGVFGGMELNSSYEDVKPDENHMLGLEGQYYLRDDVTLYAQAGTLINHYSYYLKPQQTRFAQLTGRYFWQDNTKFELSGSYFRNSRMGDSTDENVNLRDYKAEVEHRFSGTPIGVFASYDWWDHHDNFDAEGGDYTWKVGLKLSFGPNTLREEDRKGATLKVVDFSPISWLKIAGW
jgi:hypothetical protein